MTAAGRAKQTQALAKRQTQAVSRRTPVDELLDLTASAKNQVDLRNAFNQLAASGIVNVVTPVTAVSELPQWTQVAFNKVDVSLDPESGDLYFDRRFCKGYENSPKTLAMAKPLLLRIASAAGIDKVESFQADNFGDPFYCQWTVGLRWRNINGVWSYKRISKTIDLRKGAPATMKPEWECKAHRDADCNRCDRGGGRWVKTGRQVSLEETALAQARIHLHANCESKALLRGIREYLSLKQTYSVELLRKPFVIPQLVPNLPMDDPDVKAAVLQRELGAGNALYPPNPAESRKAGVRDALLAHEVRARGGAAREVAAQDNPATPGDIEVEEIDADTSPAPGDEKVIDVGPAGPEPPPIGQAEPSRGAAAGARSGPPAEDKPAAAPVSDDVVEECDCPCGCTAVPTQAFVEKSVARLGCVRCPDCYPNHGFNLQMHEKVGDLKMPRHPGKTAEQVTAWIKSGGASR